VPPRRRLLSARRACLISKPEIFGAPDRILTILPRMKRAVAVSLWICFVFATACNPASDPGGSSGGSGGSGGGGRGGASSPGGKRRPRRQRRGIRKR
jgi:uncharacterized membrane protein YgcG